MLLILNEIDDKSNISLRTMFLFRFFNEINPYWAVTFSRFRDFLNSRTADPWVGQLTSGLRTFMQIWIAHRNTSKYAKCMQSINICRTEINCAIFYVTSGIFSFLFFFLVFRCYKNEINGVIGNLQIFRYNISVAVESLGTCINVFNFSNVY